MTRIREFQGPAGSLEALLEEPPPMGGGLKDSAGDQARGGSSGTCSSRTSTSNALRTWAANAK